ncbi:aldehyde dehydrogenase family protein, partial [Achromobacter aegrifaciens]|uniref:aldehyde dehydrogenase family protein n=1 Tax=Achromobacter aegrifaciens TaxID=1287736 RepID=UPI0035E4275E
MDDRARLDHAELIPRRHSMTQMIINGRQVDAADGRSIEVVSPVDGKVFTTIPRGQQADVDAAVRAARAALDGEW